MDLSKLVDLVRDAEEKVGRYRVDRIFLSPEQMKSTAYCVSSLAWQAVAYNATDLTPIPDDRRGIYAFVVREHNAFLPPHGYVMYIGIAGRDSERSLRERFADYHNHSKVAKRMRVARMIALWKDVLWFYFTPVDDEMSSTDLESLEKQLNAALMPPVTEGDIEATIKNARKAFT